MKRLEEFGYKVSKNYDAFVKKLKENINSDKRIVCFVDDYPRGRIVYFAHIVCDEIHFVSNTTEEPIVFKMDDFDDDGELFSAFEGMELTFIDPNPPNPNAIYYADGQEVNIDDNFKFIRHNDKSIYFIFFGQGSLYATNGQYIKLLSDFISVGWKNDCMTNAEKVETREDK